MNQVRTQTAGSYCRGNCKRKRRPAGRKRFLRRRMAAAVMFLFVFSVIGFGTGILCSAHAESGPGIPIEDKDTCYHYKSIQVQPGDSLWSIAEEYMPESYEDVDSYIKDIMELNTLPSEQIHADQYLMVACAR